MKRLELRIPPLAVAAIAAALMWVIAWMTPALSLPFPGHVWLALAVALTGTAIIVVGIAQFRRAETTVNPMTPGSAARLVGTGIFRVSRNPMYLGFVLMLAGWGIYLANPVSLFALPLVVLFLTRFQIVPEEKALRGLFGAEYEKYQREVRRWL